MYKAQDIISQPFDLPNDVKNFFYLVLQIRK